MPSTSPSRGIKRWTMSNKTIGISAYGYGPQDALALARAADELGFDALWLGEHYIIPRKFTSEHPGVAAVDHAEEDILAVDVRIYDPWFLLGAIAGCTESLKIGTAIVIAPMLHPLLLARASVTAHDVSGGRFLLGVGAGWLKEEFDAFGLAFDNRGARLDDGIDILRKAWKGGFFEHRGAHGEFGPLQISPHAVDIPLVCGGNTGPALRRVGRIADAWINSAMIGLDEAVRLRKAIETERRTQGTAERPFAYYVRPMTTASDEVERFHSEGFDNIVLWGHDLWSPKGDETLRMKRDKLAEHAARLGLRPRVP
jgi:probable F420-dependent oxidoreductase